MGFPSIRGNILGFIYLNHVFHHLIYNILYLTYFTFLIHLNKDLFLSFIFHLNYVLLLSFNFSDFSIDRLFSFISQKKFLYLYF